MPFRSISCASPLTLPSAACTSGRARVFASSELGNRRRERALAALDVPDRGLAADHRVRALPNVGVDEVERLVDRVGQHERAADHRDAEDDGERRQHRAELPPEQARERDADHVPARPMAARISGARLRGSSSTIAAVGEEQDAVGDLGRMRVVRDHHHRLAELLGRRAQELEDAGARLRVEVAGRLVGEHDRRPRDERAGDRDALLLAARELGRTVVAPVGQPDPLQQVLEERRVRLLAGDRQRQARRSPRRSASAAG